jgi:hypothetical protein
MKLFRQLFFVLIAAFILPQLQGGKAPLQQRITDHAIHAAYTGISAVNAQSLSITINKFKRRPVGINDCHDEARPAYLTVITARFVYVDKIRTGYHYNPYLNVPIPLRSWRGPPTA